MSDITNLKNTKREYAMGDLVKYSAFAMLMVAPWAQSAPHIDDVMGAISEGKTITLIGENFGERNDAPVMFDQTTRFWEEGQEESPYSGVPDGGTVPTGEQMPYRHNLEDFFEVNRRGSAGNDQFSYYHAAIGKNHWGHYMDAWLAAPTAVPDPATGDFREMYMTWLLRLSFEPTKQTGSHKFIRVWDTTGGREEEIRISWTQMHMTYQGGDSDWADTRITPNTWARLELYINADTNRIEAWANGKRVHNVKDFAPEGDTGLQPRLIGWDSSGDARYPGDTVDLARIYIDSSPARIELCGEPKWRQCSTRAIQMPLKWTDQEIKLNLASGRLNDLDTTYLYVVTPNGEVNDNGYPLCGDCPGAPDQLRRVQPKASQGAE